MLDYLPLGLGVMCLCPSANSYSVPSVLGTVLRTTQVPAFFRACHPEADGEENARKIRIPLQIGILRVYTLLQHRQGILWVLSVCVCVHTTVEVSFHVRRHSFFGSPLSRFLKQGFSLLGPSPIRLVWLAIVFTSAARDHGSHLYTTTSVFYPDSGAQAQISPRLCSEHFAGWAASSSQCLSLHSGVESPRVRQAESLGKSQIWTRKIYGLIFTTLQVKCRISFHERRQPENLLWYLWPVETTGIFIHTATAASYC